VHPDNVLAPYEKNMRRMPKRERLVSAERVWIDLLKVLPAASDVIILAGHAYRDELLPLLRGHGFKVAVPLEGLRYGEQIGRLRELAAAASHA
jgi:hypothetical protein